MPRPANQTTPTITREPVVLVPEDLGPKMLALNDRQRAFVTACMDLGEVDHARAAAMAGYSGHRETLSSTGFRLSQTLAVQEAMHEEAGRRLHSGKIMAVSELLKIAKQDMNSAVRLKAITMILNRVGMHEMSEHRVVTRDESKTDAAMIERITALAGQMGLDPTKLLGHHAPKSKADAGVDEPPVIDAEFAEVTSDEPVVTGAEGLEDLL